MTKKNLDNLKYPLIGLQIGNFFVQEDLGSRILPNKRRGRFYACLCICGKVIEKNYSDIFRQESCGCKNAARDSIKIYETDYKIDPKGCWIWQGNIAQHGYGKLYLPFKAKNGHYYAHRLSYEYFIGPITKGLVIDHKCHVRSCINPKHLRAVTPKQNAMENLIIPNAGYLNSLKKQCPRGHEYTKHKTRNGRDCVPCKNINARIRMQKNKLKSIHDNES